jgi:NADP-dependent 3-hydroxy acid dehydrogenase YdfG
MPANRVAIVASASGGIGAAVAAGFAQAGARMALLARNEEGLLRLAGKLTQRDSNTPVRCNVADAAEVSAAVNEVRAAFGSVDIVLNAAGVTVPAGTARHKDLRE